MTVRAFAHQHPIVTAIAAFYALCFIGLAYCIGRAEPDPEDPYYP